MSRWVAITLLLAAWLWTAVMKAAEAGVGQVAELQNGAIIGNRTEGGVCRAALPATAEGAVVVTDADDGKTVPVPVGRKLVVRLKSNPTTGYRWRVAGSDPDHLRQEGEPSFEGPNGRLVGAGGVEVFTFAVHKAARTWLELEYVRPWEEEVLRRFAIGVSSTP